MFLTKLHQQSSKLAAVLLTAGCLFGAISAQEFRSGFGGYGLRIDAEPSVRITISQPIKTAKLIGALTLWNRPGLRMRAVSFSAYRLNGPLIPTISPMLVDEWVVEYEKLVAAESAPCSRKPVTFGIYSGIEVECSGKQRILSRFFVAGTQLVTLEYLLTPNEEKTRAVAIFDSFRKLSREERNVASIQESMPPKLDQEPPEHLPISDVALAGLIGPVRRVKEVSKPSGNFSSEIETETSYDRSGFRVSQIRYNGGYAELITTWGWLDGSRVDFQSAVHYPFGEKIALTGREDVVGGLLYDPQHTSRYGTMYEPEFDDLGRVVKRTRYSVSGMVVSIETIAYSGNIRRTKLAGEDGTFGSDIEETLDSRSNVIARKVFMSNGAVFQSFSYKYVLDTSGNWIKRTETLLSPSAAKRARRGKYTTETTREILYYNDTPAKRLG